MEPDGSSHVGIPAALLSEIAAIFREEFGDGLVPNERHLQPIANFIISLRSAGQTKRLTAEDIEHGETLLAAWRDLRRSASTAREAINKMHASAGSDGWAVLARVNPGLDDLRRALDQLAPQFTPAVTRSTARPGPREKIPEHKLAAAVAEEVAEAMRVAGWLSAISTTNDAGPVARVGAKVWRLATGKSVAPATFADLVRKWSGGKSK